MQLGLPGLPWRGHKDAMLSMVMHSSKIIIGGDANSTVRIMDYSLGIRKFFVHVRHRVLYYFKKKQWSTGNTFWPITAYDKTCNNRTHVSLDLVDQITCQEACLNQGDNCVGVSCSSATSTYPYMCDGECYVCTSQSLVDGDDHEETLIFIKRPGN